MPPKSQNCHTALDTLGELAKSKKQEAVSVEVPWLRENGRLGFLQFFHQATCSLDKVVNELPHCEADI